MLMAQLTRKTAEVFNSDNNNGKSKSNFPQNQLLTNGWDKLRHSIILFLANLGLSFMSQIKQLHLERTEGHVEMDLAFNCKVTH